jgi:hypothetical protein
MKKLTVVLLALSILLVAAAPAMASPLSKAMSVDRAVPGAIVVKSRHIDVNDPSTKPYPSYTYYSQLGPILKDIARRSPRVSLQVFGHSAGGRPMYLMTVQKKWASPAAKARWLKFVKLQLQDPRAALAMLRRGGDLRVPVFINCSIHGDETNGVDAGLLLLRRLAFSNDSATRRILKNDVVIFNSCQNPDGRVNDVRVNDNGFDLNRDFINQTQPEVKALVRQIVRWHPAVFEDLHGYYGFMLIDPTTAPHDPNYEWDLAIRNALPLAQAQQALIESKTPVDVKIAYVDKPFVFEDYEAFYAPQFAMFYGLVGQTLETSDRNEDGVSAHYYGILEAATYASLHRRGLLRDQLARFLRAEAGGSQPVSADMPAEQIITYPDSYVIPVAAELQKDPLEARRAVRRLIRDGIVVCKALQPFEVPATPGAATTAGTREYPAGTYVVPMDQPLRGLANAMLWQGQDISGITSEVYDCAAWQLPESMGFDRVAVTGAFPVAMARVSSAPDPAGTVQGTGPDFVLTNTSNQAVRAVNYLVANGFTVSRVTGPDVSRRSEAGAKATATLPLGAFVVDAPQARVQAMLAEVARRYKVDFGTADISGSSMELLWQRKVAVYYDGPTRFALKGLGFDATIIDDFSTLSDYDVLVIDDTYVSDDDVATIEAWVDAGGTYIANGPYAYLSDLLDVTVNGGAAWDWSDPASYNNTMAWTEYDDTSLVTAGLGTGGYTFAFPPAWFSSPGAGVSVDASYGDPFLLAGWWTGTPTAADAAGQPVVVHGFYGDGRVTYLGPMASFRAGTEGTYRLLSNAIYTGNYTNVK